MHPSKCIGTIITCLLDATLYNSHTISASQRLLSTAVARPTANKTTQVRVRFAPSPTGHIHLGGLRAALYNYVFARQHNGKFVLRIEDTDRQRTVPGSAKEIEDVLHWAGITPDESPLGGGNHGPYEQSKRLAIYSDHVAELLNSGRAYRCFCSSMRLDLLRKSQIARREKTRYDRKCRHLTEEEVDEKMLETEGQYVIRFALDGGVETFNDLVFGDVSVDFAKSLESDPIIVKSDGYPTYHFANIVDDHTMEISHVLRGSEWLTSTTKHLQMYKAFGWQPPKYAHLPLVNMQDGTKMSKRNDHSHVISWIREGYLPDTLFNFMTNSGGGVPKKKQDDNEFWTLEELVRGFDFNLLIPRPSSLDVERLRIYDKKGMQRAWLQFISEIGEWK